MKGICDGGAEWRVREGGDRLGKVGLCKKLECDRGSKRGGRLHILQFLRVKRVKSVNQSYISSTQFLI